MNVLFIVLWEKRWECLRKSLKAIYIHSLSLRKQIYEYTNSTHHIVIAVESHEKNTSNFDNYKWTGIVCTQTHYIFNFSLFHFVLTNNNKTKQLFKLLHTYVTLNCMSLHFNFETTHAREKCATSESTAVQSSQYAHTHIATILISPMCANDNFNDIQNFWYHFRSMEIFVVCRPI